MKIIRILNLISLLATITVNALANILPINNLQTGEVSDSFGALFTPAGYVFAIWGVIYLTLAVFAVYQVLPAQKENARLDRVGIWFILANLFNGGWIFAWHYLLFPLSMLLMLGLLVSLVVIYLRLGIGTGKISLNERWLVDMPFSIYLGWISVATIANASVFLLDLNWDGFGLSETIWTVIVLLVGVILGLIMTLKRSEVFYTLVLIWAFIGITQNGSGDNVVTTTAWAGSAILGIFLVIARGVLRRKQLIARYKRS
ncbi:MAG: tryptophan-rich sensory protein [Chloroflexi bacterium HGW-Chloroflexi-3]|nr:MAG: tryptophan-rich sensory protein [Chloroflexi bacterium HGW-Chloroflexi-3]